MYQTILTALHLWDDLISQHLYERGTIIIHFLQIKKLGLRGVVETVQRSFL